VVGSHRSAEGGAAVWVLAARPKTLSAAAAPVVVGAGLGVFHGTGRLLPVLAALVGALLIQIGTNLANDYFDFMKGTDTEDRLGPVRVTQAGLIPPETVRRGMMLTLGAAFLVGVYLVWVGGLPIVIVGLASLLCAVAYTGGPYPLAYNGLGDLFVFVFFGLVAVGGTYWVQALALPPDVLLAGVAMGALSTAILVVNNLRDVETDARTGKRTLAVILGRAGTRVEYLVMAVVAAAVPVVGVAAFGWPAPALAALLGLLSLLAPLRTVLTFQDPRQLNPALGQTARGLAFYGLLLAGGLAVG
jgi:1,4-dihydroxy-2-naphthoate octaprenyltransferase